ncbi:endonuclease/exonuclease/phosphatase family protein [Pontibacter silvestris]|uniref:Endonuclease/exonuclease/phosphatase family protein n=1 Tax=Pontibacter silvestris TaxID=2305183 RepID=A0ABW4WZN5_9BACT|nr:endonuclease/exonuclease/phosphatase family protein [Pontibacter silvestris]MCC9138846.1 endonuclease/exonuclease/phosphatase family protein [Pontibacter silvestris]
MIALSTSQTSRRSFVKGISLLACVPLVPNALYASEGSNLTEAKETHRVLCCNIRVALPEDEAKGFGWSQRKDVCVRIIHNHKPDILCLQEVLRVQNDDLKKAFPDYFSFGFEGPEMDAFKEGYHGIAKNPIFFSKKRYELLGAGGFWLSETPLVAGSKSWNTARARQANWVRLRDRKSSKDFRVVNLHLDHKSQPAKEGQIKMVLEEARQYPTDYPQILSGDLNSNAGDVVYANVRSAGWIDTYTSVHGEAEPGYTVHQFKGDRYEKKDKGRKIDFIFSHGKVKPLKSEILRDHMNGVYPSDHYFLSADVEI